MTMQTDVKATSVTTSGVLVAARTRIKQIVFVGNSTAGSITLYDNATTGSGNILYSITFHTSNVPTSIDIPGEGILAMNGVYATVSNIVGLTICYG